MNRKQRSAMDGPGPVRHHRQAHRGAPYGPRVHLNPVSQYTRLVCRSSQDPEPLRGLRVKIVNEMLPGGSPSYSTPVREHPHPSSGCHFASSKVSPPYRTRGGTEAPSGKSSKPTSDFDFKDVLCLSPIDGDLKQSKGFKALIDSTPNQSEESGYHTPWERCRRAADDSRAGHNSLEDEGYFSRSIDEVCEVPPYRPDSTSSSLKQSKSVCEEKGTGGDRAQPRPAAPCPKPSLTAEEEDDEGLGKGEDLSIGVLGDQDVPTSTALRQVCVCCGPGQVRSVVVVPGRSSKCKASVERRAAGRPQVFDSEAEWQRAKRLYVDGVCSHMVDGESQSSGVLKELNNLMSVVAQQKVGLNAGTWQHPSDLTRSNFCSVRNTPELSLDQWQQQNWGSYRRFASVPHPMPSGELP